MTAVMDAVATATATVPRVEPLNVPPEKGPDGKVKYPYGVFAASLGRGDTYTLDDTEGIRWGRVTVQTFGRTTDSALTWMDDVLDALRDRVLMIPGFECTALHVDLDPAVVRDPDDNGVVGVTASLTFTATKE